MCVHVYKSNQELFEGKHKAYFESWDNGAYFNNPKFIVTHDSNGLFLLDTQTGEVWWEKRKRNSLLLKIMPKST